MARRAAPGPDRSGPQGTDAPWAAFGYLVAGVGFYGFVGWGLSVWLHATYLIPIGIVFGAVLGIYLVYSRLAKPPADIPKTDSTAEKRAAPERSGRPDDDRGDVL